MQATLAAGVVFPHVPSMLHGKGHQWSSVGALVHCARFGDVRSAASADSAASVLALDWARTHRRTSGSGVGRLAGWQGCRPGRDCGRGSWPVRWAHRWAPWDLASFLKLPQKFGPCFAVPCVQLGFQRGSHLWVRLGEVFRFVFVVVEVEQLHVS